MRVFGVFAALAELDLAVTLSLTVGLRAGRMSSAWWWGDGELWMCAYADYTLDVRLC